MEKIYKAKVLLFGEYSVINGSDALAIPCSLFSGKWSFDKEEAKNQGILHDFQTYLCGLDFEKATFRQQTFKQELDQNLIFNSSIPIGYGAGSSGALCAAVFDQYYQKEAALDLLDLKSMLGQMENFFHGTSSGLDPLISYLDQAILIQGSQINITELLKTKSHYHLFLIDTEIPRRTEPLVNLYLERYHSDKLFQQAITETLSNINNQAIQQYLNGDWDALFQSVHNISEFQWMHFKEMIPERWQDCWRLGIDADLFKIKLCGAGGGGFLIGMTKDLEQTRLSIKSKEVFEII